MQLIKLLKSESFRRQFDSKSTLLCPIAMSGWCDIGIQANCRIHQFEHTLCLGFHLFLVQIRGRILRCGHLLSLLVKLLGKSYPIYRSNVQGTALLVVCGVTQGGG